MAGQDGNQNTPNSQDSGSGGEKLIFGKYKTMEDAERAHKDLEKNFHESREYAKRIDERFDAMEQRFDDYGRGQRQEEYAPAADTRGGSDRSVQTLKRFYEDPEGVLAESEERAYRRIKAENAAAQKNLDFVNDWLSKNQDVAAYPELLQFHTQRITEKDPKRRLDKAAEVVRARILEIKGSDEREEREPNPEQIIDGPSGRGEPRQAAPRRQQQAPVSNESQLASYVTGRNQTARKPLGVKRPQ